MKKLFILIYIIITLYSCVKPKDESGPNFNVTVLGESPDCENYILKFDSNVTGLHNNYQNNMYIETNLAEEYQVAGKNLMVSFREPSSEEKVECNENALITYPQLFIINAHD